MGLTLEHIQHYPMGKNGLKFQLSKHQLKYGETHILPMNGVSIDKKGDLIIELLDEDDDLLFSNDINPIKPLLRDLSDLTTEEIDHNDEKVDVIEEIYSESWMACGYLVRKRKTFIEIISKEDGSIIQIHLDKPQCNEVWINEILLKYHFDTKFLIKEDLAINKNEI